MALTREDVLALGNLARIALDEDEAARAERDLDGILGYVDRLQKIPTDGVSSAFRPDEAISSSDETRRLILQNFPAKQNDLLKAPAVFERPKK
jgi:aspartyl/glutamyl-tRNA(Asn/Gln) amidotransferase C subunit